MTRGGKSSCVITSKKKKTIQEKWITNEKKDNLDDNQIKQLKIYEKR